VLPVNADSGAQRSGRCVNAVSWNQQDRGTTLDRRSKMLVLGQQDPILFGTALGECPVGKPTSGNDRVIPGRTQPSAEATQHLIAQEPRHLLDLKPAMLSVYITATSSVSINTRALRVWRG
jgi:hypothetical protein